MPTPTTSRRDFLVATGTTLLAATMLRGQPADQAPTKKLGWAVVGLGRLALGQVMPAFAQCKYSQCVAFVTGHAEKNKPNIEKYNIDPKNVYNYENYDSIKNNDQIDVVYNILPDSMHAEYTIRALNAGKHVLCEKPMCRSVKEAEDMIAAAKKNDRKLMIAYRLHYEPFNLKMIEYARNKTLGDMRIIAVDNYQNTQLPNIRLMKETGTGPLGDVGVYCINASRYITGEDPIEVTCFAHQPKGEPRFKDWPASYVFTLKFPSGVLGHGSCGFNGNGSRRYRAFCNDGWFGLEPAYGYGGLKIQASKPDLIVDLPQINHFSTEMDHFSQRIMENKESDTPGEEGLKDMKVLEAIWRSVDSGKAEKV